MIRREEGSRLKVITRRSVLLGAGQLGLLGVLAGRLYYLEVVEADQYKMLAEDNRINVRLIAPVRGHIVDRYGVPIAINQENYRVVVVPEQAGDVDAALDAIGRLIEVSDTDRRKVLREAKRKHSFVPAVVRENLTWDEVSRIEVNAPELPGVAVEEGMTRLYTYGTLMSHIVGYVAAVSDKDLNGDPVLELPDFRIGKNGVEKSADLKLRGDAGTREIEVNAFGRVVRELEAEPGEPGEQVTLTIDMALQDFTAKRLAAEQSASCVCMDAVTGDVLSLVSHPSYDSNTFAGGITNTEYNELLTNPRTPLQNKTIQGVYPPGSTFKPMVALAALEAGVITPETRFTCTGEITVGDAVFHCYQKGGHGSLNLHGGIEKSCDVFFWETARRVGIDRIAAMAKRFGLGLHTGVDLPYESAGLVPTRDWKMQRFNKPWSQGETLSCGIGQGYVLATPLQLATMAARLVTNRAVVPHLVRPQGVMTGAVTPAVYRPDPSPFAPLGVPPQALAQVLSGMNAVVNDPGGTAYGARIADAGMAMGGKSGTAQVRHISQYERDHGMRKTKDIPWKDRDHALFIAFAPVQAPRYVCAVVIEHGTGGSAIAAPIARDVLREAQKRDPGRQVPADHSGQIADADTVGMAPGPAKPRSL